MKFKTRMLLIISSLIILGFLVSAISSFTISQQRALKSLTEQELPLVLNNVYSDIQRDLLKPQLVSSMMANDTFVHEWAENGELDIQSMSRYLQKIKQEYDLFSAFFVSENSQRYFYSEGVLKVISANTEADSWYYRFKDKQASSEINIDPDMGNQNQLAIFINVKVLDQAQQLMGITGVALNINNVTAKLQEYYFKYGKQVYFLDNNGEVILSSYHRNDAHKKLTKNALKAFITEMRQEKEGQFSYQLDDDHYLLQTRYIEELDLILCVEVQLDEINTPLIRELVIKLFVSFLLLSLILWLILKTINRYQEKLESIAWKDALTGLLNRHSFVDSYQIEHNRHQRNNHEMAILMIDIDLFKEINDKFGHLIGDQVLKYSAMSLKKVLRPSDVIARWGGEEFIVLLPDTALDQALLSAERMRKLIEAHQDLKGITISIGISMFCATQNMDGNIGIADRHLYRAKKQGRNCIVH
ncbi:sensor domain-containing diguanylate cyclase [Psychromonas hadalis]|uniref:sensor domain-containing diguanylate cyclase n=1 Tax=Psychromonas hadalis TaxID=211669 RepID=UPI0003B449DF|nr:sensor domain-containing diguanylate cyclase [Psychromonas hadalis]